MDDVLEIVTEPRSGERRLDHPASARHRGEELLVEASVRVAFISGGRARPIPKPLRIAMRADRKRRNPESGFRSAICWNRVDVAGAQLICRDMTGSKSDVMTEFGFALFDTPIDCCGIVWNGRGIAGVQLPETDRRAVRNRVLRRFPGACEAAPPRMCSASSTTSPRC